MEPKRLEGIMLRPEIGRKDCNGEKNLEIHAKGVEHQCKERRTDQWGGIAIIGATEGNNDLSKYSFIIHDMACTNTCIERAPLKGERM